ncbi:MAG TPA: preprotein translocase subunit SecG [Planctomycetota bacterium]|jgi:preprotein translocase subunit SecG
MLVLLSIVFALVCLLLIFMVVITPSQSEGLAGAFGGMGSDTFFGTKAGQHINRFTIGLAVAFLLLAIWINLLATRGGGERKESMVPGRTETTAPPPGRP